MRRLFQRYTGFLRNLKAVYVLYNWLNAARLRHNIPLYRRYGLKKSIFSPLSSADFLQHSEDEAPWLDRPDAMERLERHPLFQASPPRLQEKFRGFLRDGYMILERYIPEDEVEALNKEIELGLQGGKVGFNFTGRKIFNFYEISELADRRFFRRPELLELLSFLLGKQVLPFQSLNFTLGSEQRAHSDSIHMTTEPPGYLIAAWIALEPCTEDNGPLFYYPGSHRLPYVTTADYDSGNTALMIGEDNNRRYEDRIAALVEEKSLRKRSFLAETGDVLIWHANLLHGGNPILKEGATRKSMVCHYYAEDVICYHEMTQRPALMPKKRQGAS